MSGALICAPSLTERPVLSALTADALCLHVIELDNWIEFYGPMALDDNPTARVLEIERVAIADDLYHFAPSKDGTA